MRLFEMWSESKERVCSNENEKLYRKMQGTRHDSERKSWQGKDGSVTRVDSRPWIDANYTPEKASNSLLSKKGEKGTSRRSDSCQQHSLSDPFRYGIMCSINIEQHLAQGYHYGESHACQPKSACDEFFWSKCVIKCGMFTHWKIRGHWKLHHALTDDCRKLT